MSEHANQPARDTELTDELVKVESILGAVSLPPSRVGRDELMFSAGRAAEASAAAAQRTQLMIASRRASLVSSTCSAAIAASLAVAMMWWVRPSTDTPIVSNPISSGETGVEIVAVEPEQIASDSWATRPIRRHFAWHDGANRTAPLLVMRDRALVQPWNDPWSMTTAAGVQSPARQDLPARPKTSWEMLQDFLPRDASPGGSKRTSNPRGIDWPWSLERLGETT